MFLGGGPVYRIPKANRQLDENDGIQIGKTMIDTNRTGFYAGLIGQPGRTQGPVS